VLTAKQIELVFGQEGIYGLPFKVIQWIQK